MDTEIQICIVIPCYNEEKRFLSEEFSSFIKDNPDVLLCFVNDGSSDHTFGILNYLMIEYPNQIDVISYSKNKGKAEAVRQGILYCNSKYNHIFIAFLDSDLSITLQECADMRSYLNKNICFCFGSRIMRIGAIIERKFYRFFLGRIIATFISNILDLKVYDTQCGCKLFTKEISDQLFKVKFESKWLFDVEIFFRMILIFGKKEVLTRMLEVPVLKWIDKDNSKIKPTYFFRLWFDLFKINYTYKKQILQILN